MNKHAYVQIFSLYPLFETKTLPEVLRSIANMSIDGVQFCNDLCGYTPKEIRTLMQELNLEPASDHNVLAGINEAYLEKTCALGAKSVFSSVFGPNGGETRDEVLRIADRMNRAGELCSRYGLVYGVHNHNLEFVEQIDGMRKIDFFLQHTDPRYVKIELDVGWAVAGKTDPVEWMRSWSGRVAMLHIKECSYIPAENVTALENASRLETCRRLGISLVNGRFPSDYPTLSRILRKDSPIMAWNGKLGEGLIDWPAVLQEAQSQGCMGYISEREYNYLDDTVQCVQEDCAYLKRFP